MHGPCEVKRLLTNIVGQYHFNYGERNYTHFVLENCLVI